MCCNHSEPSSSELPCTSEPYPSLSEQDPHQLQKKEDEQREDVIQSLSSLSLLTLIPWSFLIPASSTLSPLAVFFTSHPPLFMMDTQKVNLNDTERYIKRTGTPVGLTPAMGFNLADRNKGEGWLESEEQAWL